MRKLFYLCFVLVLCSHDLYMKMDSYFLKPNQEATLSLYNGTFEKSENIITRDRMLDASLVAHGKRTTISPERWNDQDSTITQLPIKAGKPGTYVAGVSTMPRNIELSAEDFNSYLEHDGVLDMLEQRAKDSVLDRDAVESYEKHVKAIYQVGDVKTNDWSMPLNYPIEFVPIANPYEKYSGGNLEVQLLLEGKPLSNQLVYADYVGKDHHTHGDGGHEHSHGSDTESHTHTSGQKLRTNDQGIITVELPAEGIYYMRTIYMTTIPDIEELTHRSKWATLSFEVSHEHGEHTHTHDHHDEGIPTWLFVVGSFVLIGLLFLVFKKKS